MNNDIKQKSQQGFTLIEVMITVVIVAILAAIALPAYQGQMTKSRRTQAHICLTNTAQLEERYYIQNNTFVGGLASFGYATTSTAGTFVCPDSTSYLISAAEAAATFTVTATRTGPQANDTVCGNFTLTQTGAKGIVGGSGTAADCW